MRLLIIAPESFPVPSAKGTSVETCIYTIAANLAKTHLVTVVSRRVRYLPDVTKRGNLHIIRVASTSQTGYIKRALQAVAGQSFDYIQVDNRPSFLAAVRKQFPYIRVSLFLHSLTFVTPPKAHIGRVKAQLIYADDIITNSNSLCSHISELYPAQARKIEAVHLGVDVSQFYPPSARERAEVRAAYGMGDSFVILYAGRFIPLKGIPVLIRAADLVYQEVPTAKLLLAGSGKKAYVAYIGALAKRAQVPVRFLGAVPWRKMRQVYWGANVFVCPSQGHEAFGLVVLEALASGLPTVASLNGGIREIITHNVNGLLVKDYSNPRCFAESITRVAKDSTFAKRLGGQGRSTCERYFSWQATAQTLERLYFGGE